MAWNDKLVSVIILTYNSVSMLPRALASVFSQDYPRLEIIVTDDGSKDFNADEVTAYIESHKTPNVESFTVVTSPINTGTVSNLRRALRHMHGDYYINFGADDAIYSKTVISDYIHTFAMRNWEPIIVTGRMGMYSSDLKKYLRALPTAAEAKVLLQEDPKATLNALASSCAITTVSSCFRKDFPELVDAYDPRYKIYEDYPTFLRMARKGYTPVFINRIMMKHAAGGVANGAKNPRLAKMLYEDRKTMWQTEFTPYIDMFSEESIEANKKRREYEEQTYKAQTGIAGIVTSKTSATSQLKLSLWQKIRTKFIALYSKARKYMQVAAFCGIAFFAVAVTKLLPGTLSTMMEVLFALISLAFFALSGAIYFCKYYPKLIKK